MNEIRARPGGLIFMQANIKRGKKCTLMQKQLLRQRK